MKKLLFSITLIIILAHGVNAQILEEGVVSWDSDKSVRYVRIFEIQGGVARLGCRMVDFIDGSSPGMLHDGVLPIVTHYIALDVNELTVDSIDSSNVPLATYFDMISEDEYCAVRTIDSLEEDTAEGTEFLNPGLAYGWVDISTQTASYLIDPLKRVQDILNFKLINGSAYTIYTRSDGESRMEKRSLSTFNIDASHTFSNKLLSATYNEIDENFVIFSEGSSGLPSRRVEVLELDGSTTLISNNLDFEAKYFSAFSSDTFIVESAVINDPTRAYHVNLYGSSGQDLGTYNSEFNIETVLPYGEYFVIIAHNDSDSVSSPIRVSLVDHEMEEIFSDDYGYSSVWVSDYTIISDELYIAGYTNNHYNRYGKHEKDSLYMLSLDLTLMVGGTQESSSDIRIFPNPSKKQVVFLESSEVDLTQLTDSSIKVVDMSGKQVRTPFEIKGSNQVELDVSDLHKGVHILYLHSPGGKTASRKFVVE